MSIRVNVIIIFCLALIACVPIANAARACFSSSNLPAFVLWEGWFTLVSIVVFVGYAYNKKVIVCRFVSSHAVH